MTVLVIDCFRKTEMLYLYGAWVGRFLVDALHQLVADAALVPLICRWGWITEIHLDKGGNKLMQ